MPGKSKAQRQAAGIAHAIQKGEVKPQKGKPSAEMAKSMTMKETKEFAQKPKKK
jgi:Protein of unknwon function (DUF3008)